MELIKLPAYIKKINQNNLIRSMYDEVITLIEPAVATTVILDWTIGKH